jgi:dienelactone hydrolase
MRYRTCALLGIVSSLWQATLWAQPLVYEVRITPQVLAPEDFIKTREPMPVERGPVPEEPVPEGPVPETYKLPFVATDPEAATQWQKQARARLFELVERQQPRRSTDEVPLDFQLGQPEDKGGYKLYPASFQGNDAKARIGCLLAVPAGQGPFPAMLAMHGHGGSCDAVFDPTANYHGMADRFARGGYVVLAPSFPHREYCATMLWDLLRLVDILQSRPEVDRERLGVAGLSMGGEWTMWSAACDPRLKAAVVSGWMCTTEGVFAVPNCPCWELPGFVDLMDVCEVHLLIAPRPLLFESAEHDNCFPIKYTRQGFTRVRAGYRVFGAEDNVRQDVWPAGHEWHGDMAYPFIDKALGGHAAD